MGRVILCIGLPVCNVYLDLQLLRLKTLVLHHLLETNPRIGLSYGPNPLQDFKFPKGFEHVITRRVEWKEVVRTSREAHTTSRRFQFAAESITVNHNQSKCRIALCSPNGYIYNTTPVPKVPGHCGREGRTVVSARVCCEVAHPHTVRSYTHMLLTAYIELNNDNNKHTNTDECGHNVLVPCVKTSLVLFKCWFLCPRI